jgi:hypothetical protein
MRLWLVVYIQQGPVVGCGIAFEFGYFQKKDMDNIHKVAQFVPNREINMPKGQVDWSSSHVVWKLCKIQLVRFRDQGTIVTTIVSQSYVSNHQSPTLI